MAGVVGYGQTGAQVTNLQNQLRSAGYNIAADGVFGQDTLNAVKSFQQKNGLSVDGLAGNQTFGALSKIGQKTAQPAPQTQQTQPAQQTSTGTQQPDWLTSFQNSMTDQINKITQTLQGQSQADLQSELAGLGSTRDNQIAAYQRAYSDAQQQASTDTNQANTDFKNKSDQIDKQAYDDTQMTNVNAQMRGIQNSQQVLGLQNNDQYQKNTLINQNTTTRDQALADITARLQNAATQRDLNVANANSQYGYAAAQAQGKASSSLLGAEANLQTTAFQTGTKEETDLHNMAVQNGYDLQKMNQQQQNDLQKMMVQHGYDLDTLKQQTAADLQKMSAQFGFDMSKLSAQHQNTLEEISAQTAKQQALNEMQYQDSLQHAMAQYQPGTPEYTLAQEQAQAQKDANDNAAKQQALGQMISKIFTSNPPKNPGAAPAQPTGFGNYHGRQTQWQDSMAQWNTEEKQWQAYQRWLKDPTSVTPDMINAAQGN